MASAMARIPFVTRRALVLPLRPFYALQVDGVASAPSAALGWAKCLVLARPTTHDACIGVENFCLFHLDLDFAVGGGAVAWCGRSVEGPQCPDIVALPSGEAGLEFIQSSSVGD
jgi:hypothetical protein